MDETFVEMLDRGGQLRIRYPLIVFIGPAGLQKVAGTGTVDIDFSPGPTTNGTDPGILGGAEPFGWALGA